MQKSVTDLPGASWAGVSSQAFIFLIANGRVGLDGLVKGGEGLKVLCLQVARHTFKFSASVLFLVLVLCCCCCCLI